MSHLVMTRVLKCLNSSYFDMYHISYSPDPCHVDLSRDDSSQLPFGGRYVASKVSPLVFDSLHSKMTFRLQRNLIVYIASSSLGHNGVLIFQSILKTL